MNMRPAFWEKLTDAQKEAASAATVTRDISEGASVRRGDEECSGMLTVEKGALRVYMLSEEGRDITLYRLREGDVCVLSARCALSEITFEVHIDAETDTRLSVIRADVFSALMRENIYVSEYAYRLATERFSDVMWAMQQILFMRLDQRLAVFLIDESARESGDTLRLTHERIARYMGSAREAVTRMLKYFAEENLVSLSRGGVTLLDKRRLRALASDAGSSPRLVE